jgi:hypothetical protein
MGDISRQGGAPILGNNDPAESNSQRVTDRTTYFSEDTSDLFQIMSLLGREPVLHELLGSHVSQLPVSEAVLLRGSGENLVRHSPKSTNIDRRCPNATHQHGQGVNVEANRAVAVIRRVAHCGARAYHGI